MRPFEYASPTTREQALSLLAAPGSAPLAGGSDLLALMKDRVETPARLVNLKGIRDLRGIKVDPKAGLRIGALVTLDELAGDPALRFEYGALADAAGRVAGPQIRNVATVGGNLCQRPRCWYFRNGFGLLAVKDGRSMVVEGDNRYHSIFNDGSAAPALFVLPSTVVPLLVALGTQVTILGPRGERQVDLERFYRVPKAEGEREHDLAAGEIVAGITVSPVAGRRLASYEVRQRETLDWSLATASVTLQMDGPRVAKARVVLGQVAPIPWTATAAEELLQGKTINSGVAEQAGEAAVQGAKPLSRNRYKIQLARVAVKRAVLAAAGMGV
ncbi:MAG TPA: xanthine dehydrogenase family protein subunit M [Thermoanaerobaculia bacterium]|nr:xanthine dehydrogenase family protein subunit M [Thermoanaerobaculia bacterium]